MNSVLSKQFSLEVYNRFQSLCDVSDIENSLESTYDSLIACTESVAKEMLPRKKKASRNEAEKSTPVENARAKLKEASLNYHKDPSRALNQKLKSAKKNLDDAYLKAEADFILGKINTLEHLHTSNRMKIKLSNLPKSIEASPSYQCQRRTECSGDTTGSI